MINYYYYPRDPLHHLCQSIAPKMCSVFCPDCGFIGFRCGKGSFVFLKSDYGVYVRLTRHFWSPVFPKLGCRDWWYFSVSFLCTGVPCRLIENVNQHIIIAFCVTQSQQRVWCRLFLRCLMCVWHELGLTFTPKWDVCVHTHLHHRRHQVAK